MTSMFIISLEIKEKQQMNHSQNIFLMSVQQRIFIFLYFVKYQSEKKSHQQSVIDLIFITEKVKQNTEFCESVNE